MIDTLAFSTCSISLCSIVPPAVKSVLDYFDEKYFWEPLIDLAETPWLLGLGHLCTTFHLRPGMSIRSPSSGGYPGIVTTRCFGSRWWRNIANCGILTPSTPAVPKFCCPKGPASCWSDPLFLIFDIWALWRSVLSVRASECHKLKMVGRPVWQSVKPQWDWQWKG